MSGTFVAPVIPWGDLAPVIIVLGAGVAGILVEAFVPQRVRRGVQLALGLAAPAAALVAVALLWAGLPARSGRVGLGGSIVVDGPALVLQAAIALFALVATLVIAERVDGEDAFAPQGAAIPGSAFEEQARAAGLTQTEVFPLVLLATGGMLLFPATADLLTLFVALEVLSLPLYLLTGLSRRRRLLSQEASLKYFLLGAFASALFLFGIALLYGFSGSVRFADIAEAVPVTAGMDGLLLAGAVLVAVGLLFKVGAVPFHSWTPDVYQGAPTPVTAFMSAGTKIAAFGALLRFLYVVVPDLRWDLDPVLWTVAIATMVVGTLATLAQTDVKRLLGYSAIAHTGFILTGMLAIDVAGITSVLFYLIAYGAASVGAFAVVFLVRERAAAPAAVVVGAGARAAGDGGDGRVVEGAVSGLGPLLGEASALSQWAGLGRRHPVVASVFTLFLLSFAGIPLTAGFVAKFGVFSAAIGHGATPLAIVGVLMSAIAVFVYVRVIVLMFFTAPAEDSSVTVVERGSGLALVAIGVCAAVVVALGVFPQPVLDLVAQAAVFVR